MLHGKTGTGKELFDQSIHSHSLRRENQYIAINCAAIPENLLEGNLFGTARGAFTGVIERPGLFEQASGGPFFSMKLTPCPKPVPPSPRMKPDRNDEPIKHASPFLLITMALWENSPRFRRRVKKS